MRAKTHLFETQSSIAQINPQTKSCGQHYHTYATIEILNLVIRSSHKSL